MNTKAIKYISFFVLVILAVHLWDKHFYQKTVPALPAPTVMVQHPQLTAITDFITQTGTTVAFNSVDLVARIKGFLDKIEFTDGTFVKKGSKLFVIEPLPYLEKLKEAQATLASQQASYAYDQIEYDRQQRMYKQNATSLNSVQAWKAKALKSKADIAKASANLINAEINYSYTRVLAPFDGRMGRHLVDVGNLVGNGAATKLATIEQLTPIYVYFNLNELDLIKIRDALRTHSLDVPKLEEVPVYVAMQHESRFIHQGKLNFVNTGLNASTGTMEFRALLKNEDYTLLPGLFVQVRIPVGKPGMQLTVPNTAVLYDQRGAYLLTVDAHHIVVIKRVTIGTCDLGKCAVTKGIQRDDRVIVDGLQHATPGSPVTTAGNP